MFELRHPFNIKLENINIHVLVETSMIEGKFGNRGPEGLGTQANTFKSVATEDPKS